MSHITKSLPVRGLLTCSLTLSFSFRIGALSETWMRLVYLRSVRQLVLIVTFIGLRTSLALALTAFLERINWGRRPALHINCIFLRAVQMGRGARKNTTCACLRWCYQYQTQAPLPPMQIKRQYFPGISQAFSTNLALLVSSFLDWASARFSSPTCRYTLLVPIPSHKGRCNESSLFWLWSFRELCLTQLPQSKMMPFSYSSSTDDFILPSTLLLLPFTEIKQWFWLLCFEDILNDD